MREDWEARLDWQMGKERTQRIADFVYGGDVSKVPGGAHQFQYTYDEWKRLQAEEEDLRVVKLFVFQTFKRLGFRVSL
jgi:hypothetical protein